MKKLNPIIFSLIISMIIFGCKETPKNIKNKEQTNLIPVNITIINFHESEYDFGTIKQGSKVNKYFKFTNTGTKPLIIKEVLTSCGCTAPHFPKTPINPGKSDSILLEYNSTGHSGIINKKATIKANIAQDIILTLKGTIN